MTVLFCLINRQFMPEQNHRHYYPLVLAAIVIGLVAAFGTRAATKVNYVTDTDLALTGASQVLKIMAGSEQEGLTQTDTSFTVTVGAGEAFIVRSPGPTPAVLENDAELARCNVLTTKENQLVIRGPRTVTVTPGPSNCSTANSETNVTPLITLDQPAAGTVLSPERPYDLFWQNAGTGVPNVAVRLSADGGATYPYTLTDSAVNNGFYKLTVPTITTSDHGRLKVVGYNGAGEIVAIAVSPSDFHVEGKSASQTSATPTPSSASSYDYNREAVIRAAATIDADKGFSLPAGSPAPFCAPGLRVKNTSDPAVYFCGSDGKRHAFPNQKIHDSWYNGDFNGVAILSDAALANVPLGVNVTYRPGERLVKIQTDPKVYAVDKNATLRWVPSEEVAQVLYGADWNQMVDDVPDSFFADYTIGDPIALN